MVYNADPLHRNECILKDMICGFLKNARIRLSLSLLLAKMSLRGEFMARGGKFVIKGEAVGSRV
jgi:hypothetical protein